MVNYVIGAIVIAIVFLASRYIYVQKKKGVKCIGCPVASNCTKSNCNILSDELNDFRLEVKE